MMKALELIPIIDALEEQEAKLLSWGDTGGVFSEDELEEICERLLPNHDAEDVLDELEHRYAMIYPIHNSSRQLIGYRSRMSHAVHLFRNLRQWMHGQELNNSKTLVSDFRFLRRARSYPIRDKNINELTTLWSQKGLLNAEIKQAIIAQVGAFDLAGFQSRATERIFEAWPRHKSRVRYSSATIVCSGTGSGKTMAFYLPALSSLASDLSTDSTSRVRILAIYPRNELLKDQFNETWQACRKLDSLTHSIAGRKIRIGALYGDVPENSRKAAEKSVYTNSGLVKCGTESCNGEMRWNIEDLEAQREQLTCNQCGSQVGDDEVILTRSSMEGDPPDILFTTTEMLNQQIGKPGRQKLFGINVSKPIPVVLLDEVHTYGGNQGAQTAFLLRRWMKMAKTSPHFVGLSATLSDAENFFSRLTGTNPQNVQLIEPLKEEMTEEGAEYLVVLRGDPVSQTALLSTTIQASMLTRRILDDNQKKPSKGIWGSKTFIFTDDLDVTNRLYSQLADAEGWWQRGRKLTPNNNGPLAQLRNPNRSTDSSQHELLMFGQDWGALQRNGFSLDTNDRAKISRTSSQDRGVQSDSDVVVATATLEVGYNDHAVGAVIQHKSPRSVASYLQRKGRAGRTRSMRPWMIAVLSDFGRDREAYQNYEKLLDPEVKLQGLPIDNGHIQRMQAAMATLNWLEDRLGGIHLWTKLNYPKQKNTLDPKLKKLQGLIEELLSSDITQDELSDYIKLSLKLTDEQLTSVLWQPPRSIMMEFIPTLRRRIKTCWGKWDEEKNELVKWVDNNSEWGSPVPEFIPDKLFSDLNLPTININLDRGELGVKAEGMSFFQALKEFSPGRISKRFATYSGQSCDWVIPEGFLPTEADDMTVKKFEIEQVFGINRENLGGRTLSLGESVDVIKPYQMKTQGLFNSQEISETSNSFLIWHSNFQEFNEPEKHMPPAASLWKDSLKSIDFYTHRSMTYVDVTRFNTGASAEFKFKRSSDKARVRFEWSEQGRPVAIGTCQSVDGMKLQYSVSKPDLLSWLNDEELLSSLRLSYFQDQLRNSSLVERNKFTADWLFDCFLAAFLATVSDKGVSLKEAVLAVKSDQGALKLTEVPYLLFQQNAVDSNTVGTGDVPGLADQKLQKDLIKRLQNIEVVHGVVKLADCLYRDLSSDEDFHQWAFVLLGNTLSAALKQTVTVLLPDVDERSLLVDPEFDASSLVHTIWLTEEDSGGAGIITQIQDMVSEDPLEFLNIFAKQVESSEYEQLDTDLTGLLRVYGSNVKVKASIKQVRDAMCLSERISANHQLKNTLTKEGFHYSHSFASVLHSRILKAGSSVMTDTNLIGYLVDWGKLEEKTSLELPVNIAAFVLAYAKHDSSVDNERIFNESCAIQAVLWPRGAQLRQSGLQFYNPFKLDGNTRTERKIAAKLCEDTTLKVDFALDNWHGNIQNELSSSGRVDLFINRENCSELNQVIAKLHTKPIDTFGLLLYPRITLINYQAQNLVMRIELAEAGFEYDG